MINRIASLGSERIEGAACEGNRLVTWGERLLDWNLVDGSKRVLRGGGAPFGRGGCLAFGGVVVTESGEKPGLALYDSDGRRTQIDTGVIARDVLPATLFGRRGLLLVHRGIQVRFYEPADRGWSYREIYSFYSASEQGGLLLHDVDRDERPDIICGNYWIQCPAAFDLPWRLYAIRVWAEEPLSAVSSFVLRNGRLLASQSAMPNARLAWFDRPPDPKQLWPEERFEGALGLHEPHLLDTPWGAILAERGGNGRLLLLPDGAAPEGVAQTEGILYMALAGKRVLLVEPSRLSWKSF